MLYVFGMSGRFQSTMSYTLSPSPEDDRAIRATLDDYGVMMGLLDEIGRERGASSNLVALHEQAYAPIREKTRLPARLVTLGLRDHANRQGSGAAIDDLPLDGRLYAIKSPTHLSLSTVEGRRLIPYAVAGYEPGWFDHAEARLVLKDGKTLILVGIATATRPKETNMATEGILSRIGRVIAGLAHGAADTLEGANATATVEQSIREIDAVAEEARVSAGKARAEEHRIKAKIAEINDEIDDLAGKIETGLASGREDLVKPVVGLQIDLEAQRSALETALAEVSDRIEEAGKALQAVASARQDAVARLSALKKSKGAASALEGESASVRNEHRLARSLDAISRVTGVPGRPATGASEVEELARLQREKAIQDRLDSYKGSRG
ncbi:phage shock protein A (PspA) family protein [Bosea psychrotolerans]|uniref:Phage shock protein A (PspA) family protein n=2 Tax=Bosea psychrotolerans TaxID=1871628 RepID=A0A2S4MF12_9HYPH|nr:phage shock protein A (PspA) family protein [Bosea psychrotolerans]